MGRRLTIGALAKETGVPVKTLRFYSDEGLLPPADRSPSGYRLYTEEHVARVALIRTLREAGIGLDDVSRVLRRDVSLPDVLRLRLGAIEAHIVGLQRIATALRVALHAGATEDDLRRITMATRASNDERRRVIRAFYEKVTAGLPVEAGWVETMIEASAPDLPDEPSPAQLEAWIELQALLDDPAFVASKRRNASDLWTPAVATDTFLDAQHAAMVAVAEARGRGLPPTSREGAEVVERFVVALAAAGAPGDVGTRLREKYDPRGARFWELVAALRGEPTPAPFDDWRWLGEALACHVADDGRSAAPA